MIPTVLRLYANRGTFYVTRYHLGADETARIRTLLVDPEKGCASIPAFTAEDHLLRPGSWDQFSA